MTKLTITDKMLDSVSRRVNALSEAKQNLAACQLVLRDRCQARPYRELALMGQYGDKELYASVAFFQERIEVAVALDGRPFRRELRSPDASSTIIIDLLSNCFTRALKQLQNHG